MEDVRHPHRVGDHREVGDVGQPVRQRERRRTAGQRDRRARRDQLGRRARDVLLGGQLKTRLGLEPRLVRAGLDHRDRAAVHLLQNALPGQRVEVAADRHVRHAEPAGQLVDPDPAPPPDLVEDQGAPLLGEQVLILAHVRSGPFAAQPSDTLPRVHGLGRHPPGHRCADVPSSHAGPRAAPPVARRVHDGSWCPCGACASHGSGRLSDEGRARSGSGGCCPARTDPTGCQGRPHGGERAAAQAGP